LELISILPIANSEPQISISKGTLDPIDGWSSDKYGEKHETSILRFTYNESIPIISGLFINLNPAINTEIEIIKMNLEDQKFNLLREGSVQTVEFGNSTINYFENN
jgi:hypothetical protein